MESEIAPLRLVRLIRSHPPGLTRSDPDRRAVFAAACEQFEQLLEASARAGFAARPLTLFYAVAQAGRALAAAAVSADEWRPEAHGVTQRGGDPLTEATIRIKERGAFPLLSSAIGVPTLVGSVRLAAVWSALPEFSMLSLDDSMPRALGATLSEMVSVPSPNARVILSGLPPGLRTATAGELTVALRHYPTPHGFGNPVVLNDGTTPYWMPDNCLFVEWPGVPAPAVGPNYKVSYEKLSEVAPKRFDGSHWLIPAVDEGGNRVHPLQAWWLILFSLSTFARYRPAEWRDALDVDRSITAVALEHALDTAMTALPDLVLQAMLPSFED